MYCTVLIHQIALSSLYDYKPPSVELTLHVLCNKRSLARLQLLPNQTLLNFYHNSLFKKCILCRDLRHFKLWSLKCQKFTPSGSKGGLENLSLLFHICALNVSFNIFSLIIPAVGLNWELMSSNQYGLGLNHFSYLRYYWLPSFCSNKHV